MRIAVISPRRWRPATLVPWTLAVVAAGLLATSGAMWWGQQQEIDPSAVAVARRQAINFFTIDYRDLDANTDRVLSLSTGKFKEDYARQRDRIANSATERELVVSAVVADKATALEYQSESRAQVLVGVDAKSRTGGGVQDKAEQLNRYRVRVLLEKVDGQWLTSEITKVGW